MTDVPARHIDESSFAAAKTRAVPKQRIMPVSYSRVLVAGRPRDEKQFRVKLSSRFGDQSWATPIGRARSGIYLLTQIAVSSGRRRVLMSPFTIPDVVTMVTLAGGEPVFFDFEPNSTACSLQSLKALIDERTACVFVTHYHVNEHRLAELQTTCRENGAYLFDDCALAFGGSIGQQPIGVLTDASVFSFSAFKLLNFFWGGLITTCHQGIHELLEARVDQWPRLSVRDYTRPAHTSLKYDLATRSPLFDWFVFPYIQHRLKHSDRDGNLKHESIESSSFTATLSSRPSLAAFAEWWPKLDHVDRWLARRRAIARVYRNILGAHMVTADAPDTIWEGSCFVNFPIIVPHDRRAEITRRMMRSGYDVGQSLYPNLHRHPKFTQVPGASDNVEHMVKSTIYLPTHFGVSESYAEAIAGQLERELCRLGVEPMLGNTA